MRGCGKKLDLPPFEEIHGLKPFMIAPTAIIRGVGITFGFDLIDDIKGMTGFYDSNLDGKMTKGAETLI